MQPWGPLDAGTNRVRSCATTLLGVGRYRRRVLRVGLTGGIGSGKSVVSAMLAERGATVIDADLLAREVVAPGTPGLAEVVATFGEQVLQADGSLDRPALGRRVFPDPAALARLNAVLHPRIAALTAERAAAAVSAGARVLVHDVALLVENRMAAAYDCVVVVAAAPQTQLERLVRLRGMDERMRAPGSPRRHRSTSGWRWRRTWFATTGPREELVAAGRRALAGAGGPGGLRVSRAAGRAPGAHELDQLLDGRWQGLVEADLEQGRLGGRRRPGWVGDQQQAVVEAVGAAVPGRLRGCGSGAARPVEQRLHVVVLRRVEPAELERPVHRPAGEPAAALHVQPHGVSVTPTCRHASRSPR